MGIPSYSGWEYRRTNLVRSMGVLSWMGVWSYLSGWECRHIYLDKSVILRTWMGVWVYLPGLAEDCWVQVKTGWLVLFWGWAAVVAGQQFDLKCQKITFPVHSRRTVIFLNRWVLTRLSLCESQWQWKRNFLSPWQNSCQAGCRNCPESISLSRSRINDKETFC